VELLVQEVLVVVVAEEQVVLTITELLELPILEVEVAAVLFKQTFLTGPVVQVVLAWSFCPFQQQTTQALQQAHQQSQQAAQTQFCLSHLLALTQHKGKTYVTFCKSSRRHRYTSYRC
jgi:hypothetical protein